MAYIKQTWQCGDVVSAEKLNHMEEGIEECCGGGGAEPLAVNLIAGTEEVPTPWLDKTWQEIYDAYPNVFLMDETSPNVYSKMQIGSVMFEGGVYGIMAGGHPYVANSPDGYPKQLTN